MFKIKCILILLFQLSLFASTDILRQSEIYIDETGIEKIDTIQTKKFIPSDTSKIHRGYSTETVWVKFSLSNPTNQPLNKVLVIDNQMLDNIILYTEENNSYKKEITGVLHNRTFEENILDMYFDINLQAKEQKEYYLQVSSLSCAVYFKLNLMSKDELYQQEIEHQLILTLFFGAMVALILYNLFIYFFTKDIAYLYYVLYVFFTCWNHLSYSAIGLYIIPLSFVEIDAYLAIFYMGLVMIFSLLFTRTFLNTKKYKNIDLIVKIFLITNLLILLITTPSFYPIDLIGFIFLLSMGYVIGCSFYLWYKKEANAKFFLVGWSVMFLGWIMLWTEQYGLYSLIDDFLYFYESTIVFEAVLFSVALSSRLNRTKELEQSVKKNEILTKELHHRVKNNMQFIIAMYRLKFSKFITDKIKSALNETEGAVQSMSAIHEMLYEQNDLEEIDSKEYLENLVQRVSRSYDAKNISINLNTQITLDINKSLYLGIILNELFTNSFKYAFKEGEGNIEISLKQKDGKYHFEYKDDGVGFSQETDQKTFGLKLIKNLVKDELKGKLSIDSVGQTYYSIIF